MSVIASLPSLRAYRFVASLNEVRQGESTAGYALRRNRLAFDRARLANGASIAAGPFPLINALAAVCVAATFSASIRWYPAAVHAPRAINRLRRRIVSHEAAVICAIAVDRPRPGTRCLFRLLILAASPGSRATDTVKRP